MNSFGIMVYLHNSVPLNLIKKSQIFLLYDKNDYICDKCREYESKTTTRHH